MNPSQVDPFDLARTTLAMKANGTSIIAARAAYLSNKAKPVEHVGGKNPDATVLVIDSFKPSNNGSNHGETVVDVMKRAGLKESDIQRVEHKNSPIEIVELLGLGPESNSDRVDEYIELSAMDMISATHSIISEKVNTPDSKIKTISHSIGTQALDIGFSLMKASIDFNPETNKPELSVLGAAIFDGLGLKPSLSQENLDAFHEKTMTRANEVISNSKMVRALQQNFDDDLGELKEHKEVSYFRAAGNSEEDLKLHQESIGLNHSASHSLLSVSNANLVGALDTKGTEDTSDDEIASFSTRDPNVRYLANGVNIVSRVHEGIELIEGTSFAAPHVAARHELARRRGLELHQLPGTNNNFSGPLAVL